MKSKSKLIKEIQKEQADYQVLAQKLNDLKMKVWREELPFSMGKKKMEQIEFHIIEIQSLLQACELELESTLDDLINE